MSADGENTNAWSLCYRGRWCTGSYGSGSSQEEKEKMYGYRQEDIKMLKKYHLFTILHKVAMVQLFARSCLDGEDWAGSDMSSFGIPGSTGWKRLKDG